MNRTRLQVGLAVAFFVAAVVTAVWPDWIEALGLGNPDNGNGSAEWAVAAVLGLAAICSGTLAARNLRRATMSAHAEP